MTLQGYLLLKMGICLGEIRRMSMRRECWTEGSRHESSNCLLFSHEGRPFLSPLTFNFSCPPLSSRKETWGGKAWEWDLLLLLLILLIFRPFERPVFREREKKLSRMRLLLFPPPSFNHRHNISNSTAFLLYCFYSLPFLFLFLKTTDKSPLILVVSSPACCLFR